jgi:peptidoglycan glycosyltransferase
LIQVKKSNSGIDLDRYKQKNSWRGFQSDYIVKKKKKNLFFNAIKTAAGLSILLILSAAVLVIKPLLFDNSDSAQKSVATASVPENAIKKSIFISKKQLNNIISKTNFIGTDKNIFFVDTPEESYKITTSIDVDLQGFLLSKLARLKTLTRGKPQRIAIVVMEADTGKIIVLTGFDLADPDANPCLDSDYPAASIFKIITASAAVESLHYNTGTQLYFNGNKYTLYKRQLKDVKNKYTYTISFSRASVNPVFGKIGKNYLGKEKLDSFATAFGFNKAVDFELPFNSGNFKTNKKEYHLAELGCGFNNDTTISPIFGAMLTSAIVNSGNIMLPSIIEHVTDSDGTIIYKNKETKYLTAIKPETAAIMIKLMQRTISKGTAKKSFRGASRDKVLSKLIIGGKTGSLYNREHIVKYDWFTGFAKDKKTKKTIALSVVVGHRKYIGTRATSYAKMILKQYFK